MNGTLEELKALKKNKDFFVGIDSDGCVFDTMELKHKECFIPNTVKYWNLQGISKYVREAAEYVNLYSKSRGLNRFPALTEVFDLLADREDVKKRGVAIPKAESLKKWIKEESKLGIPALEAAIKESGDEVLKKTLEWSEGVNRFVKDIVYNITPFSSVSACLKKFKENADLIVVSQTPFEALDREWEETGIKPYAEFIAGQECGTKAEHLQIAAKGNYDSDKILMIGDAPGDQRAAEAVNALFWPIIPGSEEDSWDLLLNEGIDRFFSGSFKGDYQNSLLEKFDAALSDVPPWKEV